MCRRRVDGVEGLHCTAAEVLGAAALHVHGRELGIVCCTPCYSSDARRSFDTITLVAAIALAKWQSKDKELAVSNTLARAQHASANTRCVQSVDALQGSRSCVETNSTARRHRRPASLKHTRPVCLARAADSSGPHASIDAPTKRSHACYCSALQCARATRARAAATHDTE